MEAFWPSLLTPYHEGGLVQLFAFPFFLQGLFQAYLASEESGTTLGDLQDDGAVLIPGGLEGRDSGGGRGDVLVEDIISKAAHQ